MLQVRRTHISATAGIGIFCLFFAFCLATVAIRGADATPDYQVKAAFLLNFTKFTEWPSTAFASADAPISVCILGNDPFGHFIDEIVQNEAVNARRISVTRIADISAAKGCHVIYFSDESDSAAMLRAVGSATLTIGEGEKFMREGGMIAFVIDARRVRFLVNPQAAEAAGLRLSSRLLSVAKAVERRRPPQ